MMFCFQELKPGGFNADFDTGNQRRPTLAAAVASAAAAAAEACTLL